MALQNENGARVDLNMAGSGRRISNNINITHTCVKKCSTAWAFQDNSSF